MTTGNSTRLMQCDCGTWHNIGSAHRCAQPLGFEPEDYPVTLTTSSHNDSRLESERAQSQHYEPAHEVEALRRENERLRVELADEVAGSELLAHQWRRYKQALERIVQVRGAGATYRHDAENMERIARTALASGTQEQAQQ